MFYRWVPALLFSVSLLFSGCSSSQEEVTAPAVKGEEIADGLVAYSLNDRSISESEGFAPLTPDESGIAFTPKLDLTHPLKRLYHSGFVCGGVAVGDVNGDDKPDFFIANGPYRNRLYLQTSDLHFEETAVSAGVDGSSKGSPRTAWSAGVVMVDIDGDEDLDIYVCNYDSANHLFINDGEGHFIESAEHWGLALVDSCIMPSFCDIDGDGDLDAHVLTNRYYREGGRPQKPPFKMENGKPVILPEFEKFYAIKHQGGKNYTADNVGRSNYLLENTGEGTFRNVTSRAGMTAPGHGLSATWWDYNHDGRPDLYVANDFDDPDHLYRNEGNGKFTDTLSEAIPHTSWFSMGSDFGDLNGDGLFDFLVADMSATTHYGQKTTMGAMSAAKLARVAGPPPQIMKNALYLNTGTNRFQEAAELAGLADTDWTWSVKLADFDNDGLNDVFITNGMARNFNNSDTPFSQKELIGKSEWDFYEDSPTRPEQNRIFRNQGNLQFEDVSQAWQLDQVSMSYAAAYSDFDRDGDLDLVVVHLEQPVQVYRNDLPTRHRLLIRLHDQNNTWGIGATVKIETPSGKHIRQLSPATGFLASNEPLFHFGLGSDETISRLSIDWPDGSRQEFADVPVDRLLVITKTTNAHVPTPSAFEPAPTLFRPFDDLAKVIHHEREYDDFARQPLLPNKLSQLGPGIAVADYDGDGDDDFYLGGATGYPGRVLVNVGDGRFGRLESAALEADKDCEDMGAVWFDVDADGDLDLFVASGGVEADQGDPQLRNRLYLNDGDGDLILADKESLPELFESSGPVVAADFDRDGDVDLFVGSRVIPGDYPLSPSSRLLINNGGRLEDATQELAPALLKAGMVTGAVATDVDNDGWVDLVLATEWGPVRLFANQSGRFVPRTRKTGLSEHLGWFTGVIAGDLDADGDMDLVVTNFGLNTKYHASVDHPLLLYYGDFEGTGRRRLIEAEFEDDTLFPIRGKSCSTRAMPFLGEKFSTYRDFALTSLEGIYTPDCLSTAAKFTANTLESGAWINDGSGRFEFKPLPRIAQIAPAFSAQLTDVNGDGYLDLYMVQNFFTPQVETGRMDGGLSQLLLGEGDGTFEPIGPKESGLIVTGDAMSLVLCDLNGDRIDDFVVSVNDGQLMAFTGNKTSADCLTIQLHGRSGNPQALGARVSLQLELPQGDLMSLTGEVAAGSGYLSQSTPRLTFGLPASSRLRRITVRWPDGVGSLHDVEESDRRVFELTHPKSETSVR